MKLLPFDDFNNWKQQRKEWEQEWEKQRKEYERWIRPQIRIDKIKSIFKI